VEHLRPSWAVSGDGALDCAAHAAYPGASESPGIKAGSEAEHPVGRSAYGGLGSVGPWV
jgi:hypothetical protein